MGDDPFVPVKDEIKPSTASSNSSNASASGNTIHHHYNDSIGKPGLIIMVVALGLALGLSVGAVVMMATSQAQHRAAVTESLAASERRTMDRAGLAEREARIAMDEIDRLKVKLKQNTDH